MTAFPFANPKDNMAVDNPYAAPAAIAADPVIEVPEDILKKIKNGYIAGLVSAAMTLVVTLIAMSGTAMLGFSAWQLIDVALILGLTFGMYKKSRACAAIMLIYFITSKVLIMMDTGKANGVVMGLLFAYFYGQCVMGTFAYHKLMRTNA